jgi:hypothetical protein
VKVHIEKLPSGDVEVDISLTPYESLDIPAAYYEIPGGYICKNDAEIREVLALVAKAGA